jgi:Zn-dependent protease
MFKEIDYSFTPICIIRIDEPKPETVFKQMQDELKPIGFQIKFHPLSEQELKSYNITEQDEKIKFYSTTFITKNLKVTQEKKKKSTKIQLVLVAITGVMVFLSGLFYVIFLEPYYSTVYQTEAMTYLAIFYFCLGMFAIIVVHEFGHVIFSRRHKIDCSYPYLIPGPPPFGMLGAFVSIKDDPQTRNQQFDVAIGGIVFGLIISIVLIIIGFLLSEYMDIETYIQLRANQGDRTLKESAEFIGENINQYNLLFLGLRNLFFQIPSYGYHYGTYLPDNILILHPLAYAGWIGILLSGLNLIPISFLDGGHVLRSIFPSKYTRCVGLIIGAVLLLSLSWDMYYIVIFGLPGATMEFNSESKSYEVPNPMVEFKKSRKLFAFCLIGIFIMLYPLTYDNLLFGFGF